MAVLMATFMVPVSEAASRVDAERDTYPKNHNLDVINYAFELILSDDTDAIQGVATIEMRFLTSDSRQLRFDLINEGSDNTGMTVSGVWFEGRSLSFTHENDELLILLPTAPAAGTTNLYRIAYSGTPATGLIIGPNKHGDRTFFSDNWPNRARNWLPTVDHPYDKATSEMIVTAPSHYQVVSNGLLVESTDLEDGMRLSHWKQSVPIASWLYVLGVAQFAIQEVGTFDGKSIQTWVYRQDRDAGFYDFAVPTEHVLQFYSVYVGPYAYEKLANIQSNSVGGGMEAASAIFYGDNSVTGERSVGWRNVIIHEIAHQWFGNAVTEADWDDVWLSEGFATYFTLLFREHAYGRDDFVEGLKQARSRVYAFYEDNPSYTIVHDNLDDMSKVSTGNTYQKGAWILHMLRTKIGDEAWWSGIKDYYRTYYNGNATTDDFRRKMEKASGMDLSGFFKQWLNQGGHLILGGSWRYDDSSSEIVVNLAQTQTDGYPFAFDVEFGIWNEEDDVPEIVSMRMDAAAKTVSFPVETKPYRMTVDPRTVLLAESQFSEQ
jgi:aminopeptidase N